MTEGIDLKQWMAGATARRNKLRRRKKAAEAKKSATKKSVAKKPVAKKPLVRNKSVATIRREQAHKRHRERSALAQRHIDYAEIRRETYRKKMSKQ